MGIILNILDLIVVVIVVISVSRAVRRGSDSLALSIIVTLALAVFGLVSFSAAAGLASSSPFNKVALLIALVAIAIAVRMWWANEPAKES